MKNILVLVHDDTGQEARLQVALGLGRALDGHLTCVDLTWVPSLISSGMYDNAYGIADIATRETAREAANKEILEPRLANEGVPWDWIDVSGELAPCLRQAADLSDVIVVNRALDDFGVPDMRQAAGELIVRSGKPVLAVPAGCRGINLESALVAWDGSPAAATAMRAAVPLLKLASRVTLLEIDDGSIAARAEDAAGYLARNGVGATIRRVPAARHGAGEVLLQEASTGKHGYVVMGGFGHLRWIEALFGGVTRAMLTRSSVPVFFAH